MIMNGTRSSSNNNSNSSKRGSCNCLSTSGGSSWIAVLVLSNVLVYQLTTLQHHQQTLFAQRYELLEEDNNDPISLRTQNYNNNNNNNNNLISLRTQNNNNRNKNSIHTPWNIPEGSAVLLPSILIDSKEAQKLDRRNYGGAGDAKHLGGFTEIDVHGVSPATWKYMIAHLGVKSVLDVGCGRGISTTWFLTHGVDTLCVEGSHDAYTKTMLPDPTTQMVEHDFSRGPWWPAKTYDAIWCVEFLEHVGRNYHHHYLPAFRKAALLFVTHSRWGGWHHVEVHDEPWWIYKMESYGFRYSEPLTKEIRKVAALEKQVSYKGETFLNSSIINNNNNVNATTVISLAIAAAVTGTGTAPNGKKFNAQHIWLNMMVFINPTVAALPEHAHLFAEPGCYDSRKDRQLYLRPCGESGSARAKSLETPLPPQFKPLQLTNDMDTAWNELVSRHVTFQNTTTKRNRTKANQRRKDGISLK